MSEFKDFLNEASLYFMDRRYFRGVSLSGTVEVLGGP